MTKIEQLEKKATDAQKRAEDLRKEIESMKAKILDREEKGMAAAEAGDDDKYLSLKAEADRLQSLIPVREVLLKKSENPISEDEARSAWDEYSAQVNKDLSKKYTAYQKLREDFYNRFIELIDLQTEICRKRQRLAELARSDSKNLDRTYPFESLGSDVNNDLDYFFRTLHLMDLDRAGWIATLLNARKV